LAIVRLNHLYRCIFDRSDSDGTFSVAAIKTSRERS
jgi:hypothetical protein